MSIAENQSAVARLREQIEREYAAACAGLHGLGMGSARHDFIQARMARAQQYGEQLIERIGAQAALPLIVAAMEAGSRQGQREQGRSEEVPLLSSDVGEIARSEGLSRKQEPGMHSGSPMSAQGPFSPAGEPQGRAAGRVDGWPSASPTPPEGFPE